MKIKQIRNATLKITYAGKTFLIDPWLVEKNKFGSFEDVPGRPFKNLDEVKNKLPAPFCDLPEPVEKVLEGVDYYVITHIHPDHIDMNFADGTVGAPLNKNVSVIAQNEVDAEILKKSGFVDVKFFNENTLQLDGVTLTKTPARHGKIEPMCDACGIIFKADGEKTFYLAGDTIWFDGVKSTLKTFSPDVIALNCCAAEFLKFGRLIMDDEDVDCVHQTLPNSKLFLTHLDNVPHASITRQTMRGLMAKRGIENYFMPADGETVEF